MRYFLGLATLGILMSAHSVFALPQTNACNTPKEAISCGNLKCEPELGENAENCPIDCGQSFAASYNSQVQCRKPQDFFAPASSIEAQLIMSQAYQNKRSIRIFGGKHSQTDLFCGPDVVISTEKLNQVLGLRKLNGEQVVDVQPGARVTQVQEWLHVRGYTLGFAVPNFPYITMAGGTSTGSHGSSRVHPASFASGIREIELVTANGERRVFGAKTPEWDAVRVGLGTLGMITRMSFYVMPQFHLEVKTASISDKFLLRRYPQRWPKPCDAESYFWFPHVGKVLRFCSMITDKPVDAGAINAILLQRGPEEFGQDEVRKFIHKARCDQGLACTLEDLVYQDFNLMPPFKKNDVFGKSVSSHDVTGYAHRMVTTDSAPDFKFYSIIDWAYAIPPRHVQAAMGFVKSYVRKQHLCLPIAGISLRFVHDDQALLSQYHFAANPSPDAAPVMEFVTYDPQRVQGAAKDEIDQVYDDMIKILVTKYGARPHWGKNKDWVLKLAVESGNYGQQLDEFKKFKNELDPHDVFGNDLTRALLK